MVWLGILGASLATNSGEIDPGKLIVQNFGVMALPVLLMVLHGPIATNILNIYTFSVATQALDITISRRKLNLFVGVFSLAAVVFFIFQEDFAAVLDAWLIGLVAWVAAWGGVMLVHYFWLEKRWPGNPERLFDAVGTKRLPWSTGPAMILAAGRHLRHVAVHVRTRSRSCRAPSRWPWAAGTFPGSPAAWPAPPATRSWARLPPQACRTAAGRGATVAQVTRPKTPPSPARGTAER